MHARQRSSRGNGGSGSSKGGGRAQGGSREEGGGQRCDAHRAATRRSKRARQVGQGCEVRNRTLFQSVSCLDPV